MKKNRSSFFNETDYSSYNQTAYQNVPNQNMMYPANGVMPNISANSSFQAGPAPMPMPQMQPNMMPNQDLEMKIAKLERQVNRLENRIARLESNNTLSTNDINSSVNDMYMV